MRKHTETPRPEIPVRKPRIQFKPERTRRWHRNSITTLMPHALSPLFPEGERFFIRSVLAYRDQITDPQLQQEIRQFVAQEAVHTAEHLNYDKASNTHYDMAAMEAMTKRVLDNVSKLLTLVDGQLGFDKRRIELAITVGLEHFTALLGEQVLKYPETFGGVDQEFAELWNWHAAEEIEHKAVAYDVYQAVGGRYLERVTIFGLATVGIYIAIVANLARMMKPDGALYEPRAWFEIFRYYFLDPGMMRKAARGYADFYRPDFHPWDQDNRELIQKFKDRFPRVEAAQSSGRAA